MKERGAKPALRRLSVPQKPHRRPPLWRRCVRYIVLGMWISAVATYLWAIRDIEQSHGQRANGAYVDATDPSQAWWASPNVTLARRFMLVVAHRESSSRPVEVVTLKTTQPTTSASSSLRRF